MLKTSAYGLGFQHLPRDLANVNAWKTMFDPYIIASKAVPYNVNSRALTGEKRCINKGFLVPLKHRKLTFNMIVPGPLKLFGHTLFNCHNTINWWSNRPIKMDPLKKKKKKKKVLGRVLNPVFLGESPLLYSSR